MATEGRMNSIVKLDGCLLKSNYKLLPGMRLVTPIKVLKGLNGKNGRDGKDGINGKDGAKGDIGPKGDQGKRGKAGNDGKSGRPPGHRWQDKKLQFKQPDGKWGELIDLSSK